MCAMDIRLSSHISDIIFLPKQNEFLPAGAAGQELLPWSAVRKAGYFQHCILAEKQNSTLMCTKKGVPNGIK